MVTTHPAGSVSTRRVSPLFGAFSEAGPARSRGTPSATSQTMVVEVVFQYRTLVGKCDLGVGLDWDEIEQVTAIESAFEPTADDRRMKKGRKFRREQVK